MTHWVLQPLLEIPSLMLSQLWQQQKRSTFAGSVQEDQMLLFAETQFHQCPVNPVS